MIWYLFQAIFNLGVLAATDDRPSAPPPAPVCVQVSQDHIAQPVPCTQAVKPEERSHD